MSAFGKPKIGRLLAALTVAVLLLCHGAFGALHLVSGPVAPSLPAGGHAAGHHSASAFDGEHPASQHAGAEYFAVLLGIFLGGSALCLLLRYGRRRSGPFLASGRSVGLLRAAVFKLPRGPTPPLLQVFRL